MPSIHPPRFAPAWLTAACLLSGCANLLDYDAITFGDDPDAYTGASAAIECGTMPVASNECALCVNGTCCAQAQACGANLACSALAVCRMGCGPNDVSCLHACGIDHFEGIDAWKAYNDCASGGCADACASTAGPTSCGIESSDPTCNACMQAQCFGECSACAGNPACVALLHCVLACSDDACQTGCAAQYPDGLDALVGFMGAGGCIETRCGGAC